MVPLRVSPGMMAHIWKSPVTKDLGRVRESIPFVFFMPIRSAARRTNPVTMSITHTIVTLENIDSNRSSKRTPTIPAGMQPTTMQKMYFL